MKIKWVYLFMTAAVGVALSYLLQTSFANEKTLHNTSKQQLDKTIEKKITANQQALEPVALKVQAWSDFELQYKALSRPELQLILQNIESEILQQSHLNYSDFSSAELEKYNALVKQKVVIRKILFFRKYNRYKV